MTCFTDPVTRLMHWVHTQPTATAILSRNCDLSYGAFGQLVRRLAHAVAAYGEHPRVLIHLSQGAAAYAAMFGALWAGGYYSPMNLDAPPARQKLIREQFAADVAVTTAERRRELADFDGPIVVVEDLGAPELVRPRTASDLAYVIFTSGSTGIPKGVMIGRDSLAYYLAWAVPALQMGPGDRCSQHPNIGFDLSVLDIYATLCSGATLVPLTNSKDRLLPAEMVRDLNINVWISVPSVIDLMRRANQVTEEYLKSLRLLLFCGEPLLSEHLQAIFSALPDARVFNTYGPTEATVSCTELAIDAASYRNACDASVAIGDAIRGMQLHLIGGAHEDEGEIVLAGPQLGRGYWRDDERTARAFRPLPGSSEFGYYTGDWAERRGKFIFFRNRIDRQIKVHGYRFELDEVDLALRRAGAVGSHTVLVDGSITSFVEGCVSAQSLQHELARVLPSYGIPKEIRVLSQLPRNANDKIDVQELMRMAQRRDHG